MHSARGTEPTREGADHQPKGEQQRLSTQIPLAGKAACYQQSPRKGQCLRSLAILEWQKTLLNSLLIFGCCHQNFSFYFSSFYYLPPLQFGIKFPITQRKTGPQWAEDAPTQILVPLFFQPQKQGKIFGNDYWNQRLFYLFCIWDIPGGLHTSQMESLTGCSKGKQTENEE